MNLIAIPAGKLLPALAVGGYDAGSGYACIMNALSYLKGDVEITDTPDCVWRPLAYLAQNVNDTCCLDEHRAEGAGDVICPACSMRLWHAGSRLIGTAEAADVGFDRWTGINRALVKFSVDWASQAFTGDHGLFQAIKDLIDDGTKAVDVAGITSANRRALHDEYLAAQESQDPDAIDAAAVARDLCCSLRGVANSISDSLGDSPSGANMTGNALGQLARSIPTDRRLDFLDAVITEFSRLTWHAPIPPTIDEIEAAWERVNVGGQVSTESGDDA